MTDLKNVIDSHTGSQQPLHVTEVPSYVFLGVRMDIHLSSKQTGGAFSLIEAFMPPGGDGGLHVHTLEDETLHVISGELEVTIGDMNFTLSAGQTSFGPRNIPHRVRNKGNAEARVFLINTPGNFDQFVAQGGIPAAIAATLPPGPPTPEQIQHLLSLAEKFGAKVLAPPEL